MAEIKIYDTSLRYGFHMEGINVSVQYKIQIALKPDELCIHDIMDT